MTNIREISKVEMKLHVSLSVFHSFLAPKMQMRRIYFTSIIAGIIDAVSVYTFFRVTLSMNLI